MDKMHEIPICIRVHFIKAINYPYVIWQERQKKTDSKICLHVNVFAHERVVVVLLASHKLFLCLYVCLRV